MKTILLLIQELMCCAIKWICVEDTQFTKDYHDPEKRSIANALTVELNDGTVWMK